MRIAALQGVEARFRAWRDRVLGAFLFNKKLSAKAVLRFLGQRGDVIVRRLPDHRMAVDPSDHTIAWRILRKGTWQRKELDGAIAFAHEHGLLRSGGLFADIGANIGSQTVYAMLSGRFSGGIAVEPVPSNFDLLKLNLNLNGLTDQVRIAACAAGASAGSIELSVSGHNSGAHSNRKMHRDGATIDVPVASFEEIANDNGAAAQDITFVWIDAEGAEPDILKGMPAILDKSPPLVVEWSVALYSDAEQREMIDLLKAHYDVFLDVREAFKFGGSSTLRPVTALAGLADQTDVLLVRGMSSGDAPPS